MSLALKNNTSNTTSDWQPSASIALLKIRAQIIQSIRQFFAARDVLEVETPLLCHASVTDPFIESVSADYWVHPQQPAKRYYLQTSPEYAMKRLLAAGSGAIYQICKAFRQGESGPQHNPEFSMLEWYRPGFDHHALMHEMDELLQLILKTPASDKQRYYALFKNQLDIDAQQASLSELMNCAEQHGLQTQDVHTERDTWLQLLMSELIEPGLGMQRPVMIYDFPASQAALAKIQPGPPAVAARFEVYYKGIELANGFHELQDATEQRNRFIANQAKRQALKLPYAPIDEYLLAALQHGLPDCAGVALGIDRLVMLAVDAKRLSDILSFDFSRA